MLILKLIDLSHSIEKDISLFSERAPKPVCSSWLSHEESSRSGIYEGCTCEISEVRFVTSIGTYLDSPFHFHPGAKSIESLDLTQLVLEGVVIDCTTATSEEPIGPSAIADQDIEGKAALFHTGWSRYWKSAKYKEGPHLTEDLATALIERGTKLVGVDFLVVDDKNNPRRPVHHKLLKNEVLIVENLTNLEQLPREKFVLHAAPVKYTGAAAFPVRAYAVINS